MLIKKILFLGNLVINLVVSEAKALANLELRSKVLNALRSQSDLAQIKVTHSDSDKIQLYNYTVNDLKPESLRIQDSETSSAVDISEFTKLGFSADIFAYSFFNTEIPTSFGIDKKYHITYTAVKTQNNSLSHFLVYYDKQNYYPVKVTYYNGSKKVSTVEYLEYKKMKNKIWRAQVITSENHLNNRRTRVEYAKMEVNSEFLKEPAP